MCKALRKAPYFFVVVSKNVILCRSMYNSIVNFPLFIKEMSMKCLTLYNNVIICYIYL